MRSLFTVLAGGALILACSQKQSAAGESCTRSAQCAAGLVCVMRACTSDLDSVVEQSQVPMVGPAPDAVVADASLADAAAAASDAAPSDAAVPDVADAMTGPPASDADAAPLPVPGDAGP